MQDIGDGSGRVESEKQSEVGRRLPSFLVDGQRTRRDAPVDQIIVIHWAQAAVVLKRLRPIPVTRWASCARSSGRLIDIEYSW